MKNIRKIERLNCFFIGNCCLSQDFTLLSAAFIGLKTRNAASYILAASLCMSLSLLVTAYLYFRDQNKIMEDAVTQIRAYISGNRNARIECDDEGELYRLFHEVNSLVSVLNAHAENAGKEKSFLKDTISDISHQLKTPLAALNIYNGILQEETKDMPAVREFTDLSEQELDRIEILDKSPEINKTRRRNDCGR